MDPAPEDIFTILLFGSVEAWRRGRKVEVTTAGPVAFVAKAVLSWVERGPEGRAMAALLISMSSFPWVFWTEVKAELMVASSVTSRWMSSAVPGWLRDSRVDNAVLPLEMERVPRRTW